MADVHNVEIAEINEGEWRFVFYEGKLLKFAECDSDEAVYVDMLDMLPFVSTYTYQIPSFNVNAATRLPEDELEKMVYEMLQKAKDS